ncbi:MAG: hydrogenase maturation nickel metallochaperone HypA [Bryobacteraceae bacterium]
MHELSIALSILEGVAEEVDRRGGPHVYAVHLRLGPLSGVVKEALTFSFDVACEDTPFAGSRLMIEDVPVVVFCSACQAERNLDSIQHFRCPVCGSPAPDVIRGRELEIVGLEIDQ